LLHWVAVLTNKSKEKQMHTTTTTPASRTFVPGAVPSISSAMQECITNCMSCEAVCEQTLQYCLQKGGSHAEASHVGLLQDCVEICNTSAHFMLRGSPRHASTCAACADICEACAADCARMGSDAVMQECADACRMCAESCRAMSKSRGRS
jgi:hypothetical protein